MRDALRSLHTWLGHQLESSDGPLREKVVHTADGRRVSTLEYTMPSEPVADLELIRRRSQWKGDALRFALDRRTAGETSPELSAREEELRQILPTLPECYPWMLDGPMLLPADDAVGIAADAFDALARVAQVAHEIEIQAGGLAPVSDLLYMMAEAQSGVLVAVRNLGLRGDSDQRDLFAWLKDQTTRHRVYVDRHMRLDNPADPTKAQELLKRINDGREEFSKQINARKERGGLLDKLRYHAARAKSGELLEADRGSIATALDQWSTFGLSQRDRSLVEIAQELSRDHALDEKLAIVLKPFLEGKTPVATKAPNPAPGAAPPAEPARDQLAEARELLGNVSLVGMHQAADGVDFSELQKVFGPKSLKPIVVEDLDDVDAVRTLVEGVEADLILLRVRLGVESYAALKEACAKKQLLFVRLPDGYDPEQVAKQVLRQVGWRLRRDPVKS